MLQKKTQTGLLVTIAILLTGGLANSARANLIPNGDFESGNTGFTTGYTYSPGDLWSEGTYDIASNPANDHPLWASFGPHTGTAMMLVNGAQVAGVNVWGVGAIAVSAKTSYIFSTWIASNYATSPAILDFSANGQQLGSAFTASTTTGLFQQFYATWYSGSATSVTLSIVNQNTAFSGNDFALDDISLDTSVPTTGTSVGGISDPSAVAVPEPTSLAMLGIGMLGVFGARRRDRRGRS